MIPLYSTEQIRQFDNYAISSLNVHGIVLMENASLNIANFIINNFKNLTSIGLVCGKGNNGGDGFALARHLSNKGFNVICFYLSDENSLSNDCRTNFNILSNIQKKRKNLKLIKFNKISDLNRFKKCEIIVDAILGSGFSGDLNEPILSIIKKLNSINAIKISIDVPTGLNSETGYGKEVFKTDFTITLGELKKGLFISDGYENSGEVILEEIGVGRDYFNKIPTSTYFVESVDVLRFLPDRKKNLNKYSAGKVLSISGSSQYPGAAVLTSAAAFSSGAGASVLAIPEIVKKYIYKNLPEIVIHLYGDKNSEFIKSTDYKSLMNKIKWADVVCIGPGIGREFETAEFIKLFCKKSQFKFAVIDADAIIALKEILDQIDLTNCILTPHLGEFSQLIDIPIDEIKKDLLQFGSEFARKYRTTLVLKGAPTITFNRLGEAFINSTGNSGLAKFGSGDVLTGFIAGLLSQSKNLVNSAIAAVYLHGLAADLLRIKKTEYGIMSSQLIKKFPDAINFLQGLSDV